MQRRRLLAGGAGLLAGATLARHALAQAPTPVDLPFVNGKRKLVAFPEKRPLIVLTSRPPQLETPFEVFNDGLLTPNDAFFVRYHNAGIPTSIDADTHIIKIGGNALAKPHELKLSELRTQFKPTEIVAVNQCSGNSRGFFSPRVTGGQLGNGAMGNARWLGVPLKDVLARAEPKNSARQVSFNGLDIALFGGGNFVKALDIAHAMDGEVMLAYQMNGADIPLLNGYPVKLAAALATAWPTAAPAVPKNIELPPDGLQLKPSALPGFEKAQAHCTACHSAEYMAFQPPTAARPYWDAMVKRMKGVFKAPVPDADMPAIVDYLVKTYGNEQVAP